VHSISRLVDIEQFGDFIIWFEVFDFSVFLVLASRVGCNEGPNDGDDSRAHTAFGEQLELQFFNTKHLVNFLSLV
jgi:hypothetical protein